MTSLINFTLFFFDLFKTPVPPKTVQRSLAGVQYLSITRQLIHISKIYLLKVTISVL